MEQPNERGGIEGHRAGGRDEEKAQQKPLPCKFPLIHPARADCRGEMNTIINGLRLADTRLKEKGRDCTLRYTSVKLNPEQLPWLLVCAGSNPQPVELCWALQPCQEESILQSQRGEIPYTPFHIILSSTECYMIFHDVLNESAQATDLETAKAMLAPLSILSSSPFTLTQQINSPIKII